MIKAGRNGQVLFDALATTPVVVVSLNKWKLSLKTDKTPVTCFGDPNKVYVQGLPDISGTVSGFWNSDELTLFEAVEASTPGQLKLLPNSTEATFFWQGLAYLDAEIDTSVEGAPAVSGSFIAAGPWNSDPSAGGAPLRRGASGQPAVTREDLLAGAAALATDPRYARRATDRRV
jgi:hypothetical protein